MFVGIIKNETTPKICTEETCYALSSSDCNRGGGMAIVIVEKENDS